MISILCNWVAGDLGSIAVCLGVLLCYLATHHDLQHALRAICMDYLRLDTAINEIRRIDDPFVSNPQVTTTDVEVGERMIPAGQQVILNWTAANRDPQVVSDSDTYRPAEKRLSNSVFCRPGVTRVTRRSARSVWVVELFTV